MLGDLEQFVLLAVLRSRDGTYSGDVSMEISRCGGHQLTPGAIHKTLTRLEAKGYVTSAMAAPTLVRGGRAKRIFTITALGHKRIARQVTVIRKLAEGLDLKWGLQPRPPLRRSIHP